MQRIESAHLAVNLDACSLCCHVGGCVAEVTILHMFGPPPSIEHGQESDCPTVAPFSTERPYRKHIGGKDAVVAAHTQHCVNARFLPASAALPNSREWCVRWWCYFHSARPAAPCFALYLSAAVRRNNRGIREDRSLVRKPLK